MIENDFLGILCGDFGPKPLSFYDLLMFALGSFFMISFLLFYYSTIPKSNTSKDKLNNPTYQSTDVLLQSKSDDINFIIAKKSTSTLIKIIVFILVLYIVLNPFNQNLSFDYFF